MVNRPLPEERVNEAVEYVMNRAAYFNRKAEMAVGQERQDMQRKAQHCLHWARKLEGQE